MAIEAGQLGPRLGVIGLQRDGLLVGFYGLDQLAVACIGIGYRSVGHRRVRIAFYGAFSGFYGSPCSFRDVHANLDLRLS